MFKERLHITVKTIWSDLILPYAIFIGIVTVLLIVYIYIPIIIKVGIWIIGILAGLGLILMLMTFIHWLFIEPFKK